MTVMGSIGGVNAVQEKFGVQGAVLERFSQGIGTGLQPGDHAALVYDRSEEKFGFLAGFFGEGLAKGEKLVFCLHEQKEEDAALFLEQFGLAARRLMGGGVLDIIDCRQVFFPNGQFSPDGALAEHRRMVFDALAAGFSGVRMAADMSWAMGPVAGAEAFMEYESRFNYFSRALNAITVCNYHRGLFPKEVVFNAMQTHPVTLKRGMAGKNPYYLDPGVFLASDSAFISGDAVRRKQAAKGDGRTIQMVRAEFCEHLKRYNLTPQEGRVVECMLHFRSNQDISRELHISLNTVKQHAKNVYRKIGINKRMELVAQFMTLLESE